jgi:hypothetical protein
MKYRTFRNLVTLGGFAAFAGCITVGVKACSSNEPAATVAVATPLPTPQSAPPPPPPVQSPPPAQQLTTDEVRALVDDFLAHHSQNRDRKKWENCMPEAPFRATAMKFPAADHARYSSEDQSLWSQIRLDLDRDGIDDEKWLLKNGKTYKRELLDRTGKTIGAPEYFK